MSRLLIKSLPVSAALGFRNWSLSRQPGTVPDFSGQEQCPTFQEGRMARDSHTPPLETSIILLAPRSKTLFTTWGRRASCATLPALRWSVAHSLPGALPSCVLSLRAVAGGCSPGSEGDLPSQARGYPQGCSQSPSSSKGFSRSTRSTAGNGQAGSCDASVARALLSTAATDLSDRAAKTVLSLPATGCRVPRDLVLVMAPWPRIGTLDQVKRPAAVDLTCLCAYLAPRARFPQTAVTTGAARDGLQHFTRVRD